MPAPATVAELLDLPFVSIAAKLELNGSTVIGGDGEKLGAVVVMRDVTERRRAEEERDRLSLRVPNVPHADVPDGATVDRIIPPAFPIHRARS